MYRLPKNVRVLDANTARAITTHRMTDQTSARSFSNRPVVRVDIGDDIVSTYCSKSPIVAELEYIDPLCTVLESGKTTIMSCAPERMPLQPFAERGSLFVRCSALIE